MKAASAHPYDELTPERVLASVESIGFACDGRLLALNSFENRVYQVGVYLDPADDDDDRERRGFVIAKFYRPHRWTRDQIAEEHDFTRELSDAEVPVVAPLARDGVSLHEADGFRFAVFERRGGRAPELDDLETAAWLGRTMGRLHAIGARDAFAHRPRIDLRTHVDEPRLAVLEAGLIPLQLRGRYDAAIGSAKAALAAALEAAGPLRYIRLHGDSHIGNVLWTEAGPTLVDFDDARSGPAIQDLWMLMTSAAGQRAALLDGYSQFRELDYAELALVEPLRLMRQIHYAGWLAQRWQDPAFPRSFPWAAGAGYWEQHVADVVDATEQLTA